MSEKKHFISPISIDLGAKNTGVYFAHYKAGSSLDDFEKFKEDQKVKGVVYLLEKDDYTLLMQNRTINRHQKRGFDRRQMVKRLFKLIWTQHFNQEWDKGTQQAISFLFNRRGFTFLTEEYDPEALEEFPTEVLNHAQFPEELIQLLDIDTSGETVNLHEKIEELSKDPEKLKEVLKLFDKETQAFKNKLFVISRLKKLKEYCNTKSDDQEIKEPDKQKIKLSELPKWVLEKWKKEGIKLNITSTEKNINLVIYLNKRTTDEIKEIIKSIPKIKKEDSIWNMEKFNLEKFIEKKIKPEEPTDKEKKEWIQNHLNHLNFALQKVYDELKSGGRHRSKYFEEIEQVLTANYNDKKSPKYLKNFCNNLKKHSSLNHKSLKNLIGHLSNFELNLLRSYFNDKAHKKEDQWNEKELHKKFNHWVNNIWRVNPEKNKKKAKGKEYSYENLKNKLKNNNNIIDFFLNTDPNWTTPPYQDKDNRHPPKCQNLILNPIFLDNEYKNWKDWLKDLEQLTTEHLGEYKEQLKSLKSSKTKNYFGQDLKKSLKQDSGKRTENHLKSRTLQFIFDRVKKKDDLNLNKIYSHTKKLKQNIRDKKLQIEIEENKKKLQETIEKSQLPENLKTKPDFNNEGIFEEGSFLHLICKYYKLRQKAKNSRLFIHPKYKYIKNRGYENTGRFEEKNHLLVYCNHKPRRKEYQTFEDLSAVLQVSSKVLKEKIGVSGKISDKNSDEKLLNLLKNIKGLTSTCPQIVKQQKERRGFLKSHINIIYHSIEKARQQNIKSAVNSIHNTPEKNKNTSPSQIKRNEEKFIKETLQKLNVKEAFELYKLCEKAKNFYKKILEELDPDYDNKKEIIEKNLKINPAIAFYFLAQVGNIAFKERSGNANTCPVCSLDNSERMQSVSHNNEFITKASRLPAIPTRMIDGAIMRMTRVITKAITEEKWTDIEKHLKNNEKVSILIITESNQFEFEPSKESLIKKQRITARKGKVLDRDEGLDLFDKNLTLKEDRIKVNTLCPYTGEKIVDGEIDHIIPRASKYGTLNDEANLIWATKNGNKQKDKKEYSLSDLNSEYKHKLFSTSDNDKIKKWIKDTIWNDDTKDFEFGKYISFINLTDDQKKAFKHALFLTGEEIRDKVIQAIDNRNRSFVNGTQRYFAEVLANELYKKAKKEKLERFLSFDYFSTSYKEIHATRREIEKKSKEDKLLNSEVIKYIKSKDKVQKFYSHLIDAQIAFISSLSKHYNEGSFKLKSDVINVLKDYKKIKISDKEFNKTSLKRRDNKPQEKKISHRAIFNSKAGAWHFLKLIEIKIDDTSYYLKGFLDFKKLDSCLNKSNWSEIKKEIKESYCYKPESKLNNKNKLQEKQTKLQEKHQEIQKNLKIDIATILEKETEQLIKIYKIGEGEHQFGYQKNGKYPKLIIEKKENSNPSIKNIKVFLHQIDKTKVAEFLLKNFNTKSDPEKWKDKDCQILDQLTNIWYHTKKQQINEPKDDIIKDINIIASIPDLKVNEDKEYEKETKKAIQKFTLKKFFNPSLFYSWNNLVQQWNQSKKHFEDFLKEHFTDKTLEHSHKKIRKVFSLPLASTGQGWFLIKRKSWNKHNNPYIYQCLSEENIPKFGSHKKSGKDVLFSYFRGNNLFLFPKSNEKSNHLKEKLSPVDNIIDPITYYKRKIPDDLKDILEKVENKTEQDSTRACFRFKFKSVPKQLNNNFIKLIKNFPTRKINGIKDNKILFDSLINKDFELNTELDNIKEEISTIQKKLKSLNNEEKQISNNEKKLLINEEKQKLTDLNNKKSFYSEIQNLYAKIDKNNLEYQTDQPFKKE